ncbi:MAG: hypothetical protein K9G60_03480 [Pseudolabrys sp.]|nr:hypothetical protein [Pseudolabrys sp.]
MILPGAVQAQQDSKQIGPATVTIGSGIAMLSLPDVGSMVTRGPNRTVTKFPVLETFKFSEGFENKTGWNLNGSVAVPIGGATVSLNGFWARIKGKASSTCTPAATVAAGDLCVVVPLFDKPSTNPPVNGVLGPNSFAFGGRLAIDSERKVDHWGAALESKLALNPGFMGGALNRHYLALGADIRGIYQDLDSTMSSTATNSPTFLFVDTYNETLNTTYSGAYLAWGGDYSPFMLKRLWESWGLESAFRLQGGVYYARTHYDGQLINTGPIIGGGGDPTSALTLSRNDTAFIGGVTLETRKKIGKRATLSLKSEYEYYSYVPKMIYNTALANNTNSFTGAGRQFGTLIDKGHAYSARTSIRLTVALGPDELFK